MNNPTKEFVDQICGIYGDHYDDREEDSRPGGANWRPGVRAAHRSISSFQRDLQEVHGISLSRSKIQKILITGGYWSTERSREVQHLFNEYTSPVSKGGQELSSAGREGRFLAARFSSVPSVPLVLNQRFSLVFPSPKRDGGDGSKCPIFKPPSPMSRS